MANLLGFTLTDSNVGAGRDKSKPFGANIHYGGKLLAVISCVPYPKSPDSFMVNQVVVNKPVMTKLLSFEILDHFRDLVANFSSSVGGFVSDRMSEAHNTGVDVPYVLTVFFKILLRLDSGHKVFDDCVKMNKGKSGAVLTTITGDDLFDIYNSINDFEVKALWAGTDTDVQEQISYFYALQESTGKRITCLMTYTPDFHWSFSCTALVSFCAPYMSSRFSINEGVISRKELPYA